MDKHFVGLDALTGRAPDCHQGPELRILGIPSITSGIAPAVAAEMLSQQPTLNITIDTDTTDRIADRVSMDHMTSASPRRLLLRAAQSAPDTGLQALGVRISTRSEMRR